jgi:hypothetical protein
MRSLIALQEEWLDFSLEDDDAGPFLAYAPPQYAKQKKRILYVGKATNLDYERRSFEESRGALTDERIKERLDLAKSIFLSRVGRQGPSFWGLANELSAAVDPGCHDLANVAWSNVCKIGAISGIPNSESIARQSSLALETLRSEIKHFQPSVVVIVSGGFAQKEVTLKALDAENIKIWRKSEEEENKKVDNVWWLIDPLPVIWMRHPRSSAVSLRDYAKEKAVQLTAGARTGESLRRKASAEKHEP